MIQSFIAARLRTRQPSFEWTVDFEAEPGKKKGAGTVYYEGGGLPGGADSPYRFPRFMIWLESVDWELCEYIAQDVFEYLSTIRNVAVTIIYTDLEGVELGRDDVFLHRIIPQGEPNRFGVEDGKMIYTVNVDSTISKLREEPQNG